MSSSKRKFISLYYPDISQNKRKKPYITVAFDADSVLYEKCKNMDSSRIKDAIGAASYSDLVDKARRENRPLGNYVKHKLSIKFL